VKSNLEEKKIFLVACVHPDKSKWVEEAIAKHIAGAKVFTSRDGLDASSKLTNYPPHVLVADVELPKTTPWKLIEHALTSRGAENTAIIINGLPAEGRFMDEMVTGKVQYFGTEGNEEEFNHLVAKALNFTSHQAPADFYLRFLASGDTLIKEGDKADFVYFVKKGQLKAHKGDAKSGQILGMVELGEFVGEMAYINGEPRSANVTAVSDCELIEVPIGTFDNVLFKRPAWSKALMMTLAKRIKAANKKDLS
jgi:hypothetical protein